MIVTASRRRFQFHRQHGLGRRWSIALVVQREDGAAGSRHRAATALALVATRGGGSIILVDRLCGKKSDVPVKESEIREGVGTVDRLLSMACRQASGVVRLASVDRLSLVHPVGV